jgi:hypothetical protein
MCQTLTATAHEPELGDDHEPDRVQHRDDAEHEASRRHSAAVRVRLTRRMDRRAGVVLRAVLTP